MKDLEFRKVIKSVTPKKKGHTKFNPPFPFVGFTCPITNPPQCLSPIPNQKTSRYRTIPRRMRSKPSRSQKIRYSSARAGSPSGTRSNAVSRRASSKSRAKLDAECSAVVKDGVLRVILEGKWDGKTLDTSALQQKGIEGQKPRHGCRISPNEPRGKRNKRRKANARRKRFATPSPRC